MNTLSQTEQDTVESLRRTIGIMQQQYEATCADRDRLANLVETLRDILSHAMAIAKGNDEHASD